MIPTELLVKAWFRLGEWTIPPLLPGGKKLFRFWRDRPWRWASLLLIPVLSAAVLAMSQGLTLFGISKPSLKSCNNSFSVRKSEKLMIAIADFARSDGSNNRNLESQLRRRLPKQLKANVVVCRFENQIAKDNTQARNLGRANEADLVVWGSQDSDWLIGGVEVATWDLPGLELPSI